MDDKIPEHWAELSQRERAAILQIARSRIYWEDTARRTRWIGPAAKTLVTVAAAWVLVKDFAAHYFEATGAAIRAFFTEINGR